MAIPRVRWHTTWSRGTGSNCVYFQRGTSGFTYKTFTDATCLLAGRQTEAIPTGSRGGTQLLQQQHLKSHGCWSHTSHQTEEARSPTPQKKTFTWGPTRSNRAWKTFDTESRDWRVGGQRKSSLNSHWLSTWLRHINVLHIVWKPPLSSALKNKLFSFAELFRADYVFLSKTEKQVMHIFMYTQCKIPSNRCRCRDAICEMHQLALLPLKCKVSCSLHKGYVCNRLKAEMWCLKAKAGMKYWGGFWYSIWARIFREVRRKINGLKI